MKRIYIFIIILFVSIVSIAIYSTLQIPHIPYTNKGYLKTTNDGWFIDGKKVKSFRFDRDRLRVYFEDDGIILYNEIYIKPGDL